MSKIGAFFKKHILTWILLLLEAIFVTLKLLTWIDWHWAVVLIPTYIVVIWWVAMISIGAYLTIKERKAKASSNIIDQEEIK